MRAYNLPLNEKYQVLSISRVGINNAIGCTCEHCGTAIANTAIIQNEKGEKFVVGLDCVKSLAKSLINASQFKDEMLQEFKAAQSFYSLCDKAIEIDTDFCPYRIFIKYLDKKGNIKEAAHFKKSLIKCGFNIQSQNK